MNDKDQANRWYRGFMGGKSDLQRQLEKELEKKRQENPPTPRKPLKWYWWFAIAAGLVVWAILAFWLDSLGFNN